MPPEAGHFYLLLLSLSPSLLSRMAFKKFLKKVPRYFFPKNALVYCLGQTKLNARGVFLLRSNYYILIYRHVLSNLQVDNSIQNFPTLTNEVRFVLCLLSSLTLVGFSLSQTKVIFSLSFTLSLSLSLSLSPSLMLFYERQRDRMRQ